MISPTNNSDPEPDRKPDAIEEPSEDAKARVSETEPDSGAPDSEVGPRANNDGGDFGEEMETKESDVKVETPSTEDEEDDEEEEDDEDAAAAAAAKSTGSQFNSLLSEFDDFVANEKSGQMATSRALRYGFEAGDMVWGKVKSHPWWPGHVYNDALATPQVRRTRREGHVLVAFFGDSSYGWFDPAEFIPFDPNFSEKSGQTSSRNFARALGEAVDEACRRRGLGLVCKCRSPYSFRPADVPGYFIMDVPDFEPNGIYSAKQIQKSRDSFKPREALGFIKNLALSPCSGDDKDLEFAKNRATVVAYRKAVFEEFDVTYAQAFGVQPGRPARDRTDSVDHKAKQPPRAPLSGPLVIAETLGSGKSSAKQKKVKDGSKKDKYLLKRRDESDNSKKSQKVSQGKASSSSTLASADGSEAEKPPTTTSKPEIVSTTGTDSSSNGRETIIADQELVRNSEEVKEESRSASDPCQTTSESLKSEEFQQPQSVSTDQVQDDHSVEAKLSTSKVKGVKKTKVKRPREEPDSEGVTTEGEKKKTKKKKKQSDTETSSGDPQKPPVPKKKAVKRVGKKTSVASDSLETLPPLGEVGSGAELELPRLLTDLQVLALDPFHGIERSSPAIVRRFFVRFRSLVFQKSLASPPPESENTAAAAAEPPVRDIPSQKPAKPSSRSEDPTISGRKRAPSDRQEEIAAKRSKKVIDIKTTLASEKKSNQSTQKAPEPYRSGEGRETAVPLGRKTRPDSLKKPAEPTMLVMKFPPKTSLPSPAELKARFARFGPMDQSGLRVFWKSSTCRVVFLHKFDAQAACKFAAGNSSLFGSPGMRCFIKDFGAAGADGNEPTATAAGDPTTATAGDSSASQRPAATATATAAAQLKSCLKKTPAEDSGLLGPGPGPRGTTRVKFMLADEESGGGSRVETGLAGNRNNNISGSFGGGGGGGVTSTSTTSVAKMEFSVQKVNVPPPPPPTPSSSLPILPLPTQFANNSHHNHNNVKITVVGPPRSTNNSNTANIGAPPIPDTVDISQQMLSLLTRCNDVVTNVTGLLGYVPFHPL